MSQEVLSFESDIPTGFAGVSATHALLYAEVCCNSDEQRFVVAHLQGGKSVLELAENAPSVQFVIDALDSAEQKIKQYTAMNDARSQTTNLETVPDSVPKAIQPVNHSGRLDSSVDTGIEYHWDDDASCRDICTNEFDLRIETDDEKKKAETARQKDVIARYCVGCTVRNECLVAGFEANGEGMIWGGKTVSQFRVLNKRYQDAHRKRS